MATLNIGAGNVISARRNLPDCYKDQDDMGRFLAKNARIDMLFESRSCQIETPYVSEVRSGSEKL